MAKNKPLFLFDFIDKKFEDEKEFNERIRHYPDGSVLLVTYEQKLLIAGFSGNSTRFVDGSSHPLYIAKDVLVYDGTDNHVWLMTGKGLDMAGEKDKRNE